LQCENTESVLKYLACEDPCSIVFTAGKS